MFDKLIDVLIQTFTWFVPFAVIDIDEGGIMVRWGKHVRKERALGPGFYWHIPFGIEHIRTCNTYKTTQRVTVECNLVDGTPVIATMVFKYRINNVVPYLTTVGDEIDALEDLAGAAMEQHISGCENAVTLRGRKAQVVRSILLDTRSEVNEFGFKLFSASFKRLVVAEPHMILGIPEQFAVHQL